jgi:hypothetical protein
MQQARATDKLRRPWAVWLALCISLLGALAPTLSHALHAARGQSSQMVEICTSNGPRWMALGLASDAPTLSANTPDSSQSDPSAVLEHCPFCLLSIDRAAPLAQVYSFHFAEPGPMLFAAAGPTFVVVTRFDPAAPPRGPPAIA